MKYLLSILILFSGLSFGSEVHFICDEPYTFYPDKTKRMIIDITDLNRVRMKYLEPNTLEEIFERYDDLIISKPYYSWDKTAWLLNRETLDLTWSIPSVLSVVYKYECEFVDSITRIDAEIELIDISLEAQGKE